MPNKKLTQRQKKFADLYILYGNCMKASAEAGYSKAYQKNAYRLLQNKEIKKYLDKRMDEINDENIMKQTEVLSVLSDIARGNTTEEVVIILTNNGERKEQVVNKKVDIKDRLKALETLGKRYRLFVEDKHQTSKPPIIKGSEALE